jgi:hypothetical protein
LIINDIFSAARRTLPVLLCLRITQLTACENPQDQTRSPDEGRKAVIRGWDHDETVAHGQYPPDFAALHPGYKTAPAIGKPRITPLR